MSLRAFMVCTLYIFTWLFRMIILAPFVFIIFTESSVAKATLYFRHYSHFCSLPKINFFSWAGQLCELFSLQSQQSGYIWTCLFSFHQFIFIRLLGPVYLDLSFRTHRFGSVYLDLFISVRLFGLVWLDPSLLPHTFWLVYLDQFIWTCLSEPVYLDPSIWTCHLGSCLFGPVK